jgi:hypothetical protein
MRRRLAAIALLVTLCLFQGLFLPVELLSSNSAAGFIACWCVLSFPMEIPLGWFAFGVVTRILLQGVSFCRFLTAQSTCGNKTKPQVDELKTITEKSKQNDPFDLRFQSLFLSLKTMYMSFDAVRRDSATAETRSHPPKRQGERAQECPKPDSRTRRARCPQKRLRRDLRQ